MKVRITLTGTAPLLMHNARLADPFDPLARAMKEIGSKKKKTDDDYHRLARLEFEGGLYIDEAGPFIPGWNVEKALHKGAMITRNGPRIERGVFVTDDKAVLAYQGPRSSDELWEDGNFRSSLLVKVGASRVVRCRPMFREWTLEAHAEVDPSQINLDALQAIASDAGAMVGLGDYRPRYGRFTAEVEAL